MESGDVVYLKTYNNSFVTAIKGSGEMVADRTTAREWETFKIIKTDGDDVINIGDHVAFLSHHGDYVCNEEGGGAGVYANRPWIREWETHQLISSYK